MKNTIIIFSLVFIFLNCNHNIETNNHPQKIQIDSVEEGGFVDLFLPSVKENDSNIYLNTTNCYTVIIFNQDYYCYSIEEIKQGDGKNKKVNYKIPIGEWYCTVVAGHTIINKNEIVILGVGTTSNSFTSEKDITNNVDIQIKNFEVSFSPPGKIYDCIQQEQFQVNYTYGKNTSYINFDIHGKLVGVDNKNSSRTKDLACSEFNETYTIIYNIILDTIPRKCTEELSIFINGLVNFVYPTENIEIPLIKENFELDYVLLDSDSCPPGLEEKAFKTINYTPISGNIEIDINW